MENKTYYKTDYTSPFGKYCMVCDDNNLIGLWLLNQKYFALGVDIKTIKNYNHKILTLTKRWLDSYFAGKKPSASELPLTFSGSAFRKRVLQILTKIPYGKTVTYGEIASIIAKENNKDKISAQAVGGAVSHNPISIIVPCHRVIGSNKSLVGYAGGVDVKIKLLKFEGADI